MACLLLARINVVEFDKLLSATRGNQSALLMGVLNATPDSFFDGGRYLERGQQLARVRQLVSHGADIVDVGAESSRPGAPTVPAGEQLRRIGDSIRVAVELGCVVSIDTTSPEVAAAAAQMGAQLINDISCLRDPGLARVAAEHGIHLAITHSRAPMEQMRGFSQWPDDDYADIVRDVARDWERARDQAISMGLSADQILFDPGLGFSKNARHSLAALGRLAEFRALNAPILVGPGRKSFIAAVDPSPPEDRLGGTIAASLLAVQNGADIVRVHDLKEVRQALRVLSATQEPDRARGQDSGAHSAE